MVKKIMTGLAISLGAGLALTASARAGKKGMRSAAWHPASPAPAALEQTPDGKTAAIHIHESMAVTTVAATTKPEPATPETVVPDPSAELAAIRSMIEDLNHRDDEMVRALNLRIDDLQSHLPRFIDVKVSSRLREAEERLRVEFQDEQSRTVDVFLKALEQKILPRISGVEEAVGIHSEAIDQMRERIDKADQSLARLLERIEKVADVALDPALPGYANSHVTEINQKAVA